MYQQLSTIVQSCIKQAYVTISHLLALQTVLYTGMFRHYTLYEGYTWTLYVHTQFKGVAGSLSLKHVEI